MIDPRDKTAEQVLAEVKIYEVGYDLAVQWARNHANIYRNDIARKNYNEVRIRILENEAAYWDVIAGEIEKLKPAEKL